MEKTEGCKAKIPIKGIESCLTLKLSQTPNHKMQSKNPNKGN